MAASEVDPSVLTWSERLAYGTGHADFCEPNYGWTPHIVEWWNTWSSVFMAGLGIAGLVACRRMRLPVRFSVLYVLLTTVGVGSTWFHATLSFAGQLSDEIPMIWTALGLFYALVHVEGQMHPDLVMPVLNVLPLALTTFGGAITYMTITSTTPVIFRVMFGGLCVGLIVQEVRLYVKFAHSTVRWLYRLGLGMFLLAFLLWIVEVKLCSHILALPFNPHLHSWWHVLVSLSCHSIFIWIVYIEALIAKRDPRLIKTLGGLVFYVDPASSTSRIE